jgi:hypothetical protein
MISVSTTGPVADSWEKRGHEPRGSCYSTLSGTPEFERALQELIGRAGGERAAIMCAEAVPWRCHRSLIADALTVRGIPVEHVLTEKRTQPHAPKPFARVKGTRITYPPPDEEAGSDCQGA